MGLYEGLYVLGGEVVVGGGYVGKEWEELEGLVVCEVGGYVGGGMRDGVCEWERIVDVDWVGLVEEVEEYGLGLG